MRKVHLILKLISVRCFSTEYHWKSRLFLPVTADVVGMIGVEVISPVEEIGVPMTVAVILVTVADAVKTAAEAVTAENVEADREVTRKSLEISTDLLLGAK